MMSQSNDKPRLSATVFLTLIAVLLMLGSVSLAQETSAQETTTNPLLEAGIEGVAVTVVGPTALEDVAAGDNTVMISAPAGATDVEAVREGADDIELRFNSTAAPQELFDYYRSLMEQQGFAMTSVDFDTAIGAFEGTDAQHVQAVFVRPGDRIDFLLDREQAPNYVAHFDVQSDYYYDPYYYPYYAGYYGPYAYSFYGPVDYTALAPAALETELRVVAPQTAEEVVLDQPGENTFRYVFQTEATLEEIHDFYDQLLTEQGFEQVSGELTEDGGELVYARDGNEITVTFGTADEGATEVTFDLTGLSEASSEA